MTEIGLIVKATRNCNLRCAYCHDWLSGADQRMSFDVLARMTASALDTGADSVQFIWHGGEPTLLPRSFYEKALYVQSRFRRPGQSVTNSLQTNATRLDDEWARFFAANDISVSVSLDGPPELHDRYRTHANGRPSYDDVLRGMRTLDAHGVRYGVLMVIDEDALALGPDRVFNFFCEAGISHYGLLAATPLNVADAAPGTAIGHYVDPVRMNTFLAGVFDRWLAHGDPGIRIREIDALLHRINGTTSAVCTLAGDCIGRYYLVEPNGDVAHCDLFVGDDRYTLGNVLVDSFADMQRGARAQSLRADNDAALAAMRACPEYDVCNGWCPHERYLSVRHNPAHDSGCCGLRPLVEHVRARLGLDQRRTLPLVEVR